MFQERISTEAPTQENTLTEDTDKLKANKVVIDKREARPAVINNKQSDLAVSNITVSHQSLTDQLVFMTNHNFALTGHAYMTSQWVIIIA